MNALWTKARQLILAMFLLSGSISLSAQCEYTLNLYDSWGDGWNGNQIEVFFDGISAGTYTISGGSTASYVVTAPPSTNVSVEWTITGSFQGEVSYDILLDGVVVFTNGQTPTVGGGSPGGSGGASQANIFTDFCAANTPNNAGVTAMVSPVSPVTGTGLSQVEVTVRNFGPDTLTTFEVDWEFNGVAQPAVVYPGLPIMPNQSADMVLGNVSLTGGTNFDFTFWTQNPNNTTDSDPSNDTLTADVCVSLQGTYSVGTATSDFVTLQEAIDAVSQCGVAGPTTFNVAPGLYLGQYTIPEISGAGASAPVVFDGGDSTTTTIAYDGSGPENPTLRLDGSDYVTIRNFRIVNVSPNSSWGIHLTNEANNNTIEDNSIIVFYQPNIFNAAGITASGSNTSLFTSGNNANFTTIQGNSIYGGQYGIYLEGEAGNNNRNNYNRILENTINNVDDYGIYLDEQDSVEVVGNKIYDIFSPFGGGIYALNIMEFVISGNNVSANDYGIYISDGNFDAIPTRRGVITNNMSISASDAALYLDDVEETDIWHNTLSGNRGMYMNDQVALNIQNNIFVGNGSYAIQTFDNVAVDTMDYNLYYTVGSGTNYIYYSTNYTDLASWQAAAFAYDVNSVEGNPFFVSNDDLHVLGILASDAGTNVGITNDIDGDIRPMGAGFDIGADEYMLAANDALSLDIINPTSANCGDSSQLVEVVISSLGTSPITNMTIVVEDANTGTSISTTYTGPLNFGELDTVTVGTINTYNGGNFDLVVYTQLPGDQDVNNDTAMVSLFITPSSLLAAVADTACLGTTAELGVFPQVPLVNWYDAPTGGNFLAQSQTYTTPPLMDNDTVYAEQAPLPGPCIYTLNLHDSYGDGWNGNAIEVFVDGVSIGTYGGTTGPFTFTTANNNGDFVSYTVTVPAGSTFEVEWNVPGSWQGEVSYDIELDGAIIYNNGLTPNTGGAPLGSGPSNGGGSGGATYGAGSLFTTSCAGDFNNPIAVACNTDRTMVVAYAVNPPVVDLGPDMQICKGTPVVLDAQVPSSSYAWSTNDFTQAITVDDAGSYNVRVVTPFNCIVFDTIEIDTFPHPDITALVTDAGCSGTADGAIDQTISGTPGPYNVTWSSGQTTEDLTAVPSGVYLATIVDGSTSCSYVESYIINQPTPISANASITDASCMGVNDGVVDLTVTGGNAPYAYAWSDGSTTEDLMTAEGGSYAVTITDNSGCTFVTNATVNNTSMVEINLDSLLDETVDIGGAIHISVTGGTAPYFVNWNNGQTTEDLVGVVAATYTVVVTDANGCTADANYTVNYEIPIGTAVEDVEGLQSLRVFPNPTNANVWIALELSEMTEVKVDLFDAAGRQLQSLSPEMTAAHTFELNMADYPSGVYNARIIIGDKVVTQKIILNR
ncbi:MAG: right-handed parallel beta-helix repeat-containing protein [Saprospiraceae bacterium]|nr:right-handed parallel beta-helix repeat-containing protein [Saprospiraceae bacterium]